MEQLWETCLVLFTFLQRRGHSGVLNSTRTLRYKDGGSSTIALALRGAVWASFIDLTEKPPCHIKYTPGIHPHPQTPGIY